MENNEKGYLKKRTMEHTQDCKVVMLPSNKSSKLGDLTIYSNKLVFLEIPWSSHSSQYLYFTSDDQIKMDDWYLDDTNQVRKCVISDKDYWAVRQSYKKIVASTDTSLGIPAISEEWICTKYVPSNGSITDIKLQINSKLPDCCSDCDCEVDGGFCAPIITLKLTDNEVVVVDELPHTVVSTDAALNEFGETKKQSEQRWAKLVYIYPNVCESKLREMFDEGYYTDKNEPVDLHR